MQNQQQGNHERTSNIELPAHQCQHILQALNTCQLRILCISICLHPTLKKQIQGIIHEFSTIYSQGRVICKLNILKYINALHLQYEKDSLIGIQISPNYSQVLQSLLSALYTGSSILESSNLIQLDFEQASVPYDRN
ncbi:hypothetical protein FGO68_gene10382 [Halteria grandinella]|uniref:Uncharacterized protein n=1 Tax=Halteria grandinella TaxID=5974 RepID=A0A8J8P8W6_HALGN|nr:hypothetical protein FGO68_gene10382 [Halteria grandinella]